jgi:4-amino-4-deoxy-L-arabinose transferase-like glycosyltransferase
MVKLSGSVGASNSTPPNCVKHNETGLHGGVTRSREFWVVLVLAILVYGWNFWGTSIYMLDEAKNAGSAAEMIRRNDLFVPTFNDEYHDKPALQYFFMIAGYKLFGVNPFGARIFSVIMGILTVMSIYLFSSKVLNTKIAFFACLIYISSLQLAVQFRLAVPDPYLLFCLTTGWFCFYLGYSTNNSRYLYLFYVLTGLAFLAKGPIAFVLTGLTVLIFLAWQRDLRIKKLIGLKMITGALVTLAIGLPWYIASGIATGWEWPRYFFLTHNLDRYVNTFEGHGGFPLDVVVIAVAALLPSSVLAPQAIATAIKRRKEHSFFPFALSVCLAVLGFFFFSKTLLPSYPAPCFAFLSILIANYVASVRNVVSVKISVVVAFVICAAIPFAAFLALDQDPVLTTLSGNWVIFLIAPAGAVLALYFFVKDELTKAFYSWIGSFMILLIVVFTWLFPRVDAENPVVKSARILDSTTHTLAYYKRINSAYVFQNEQPITRLETADEVEKFVNTHRNVMIISTRSDWEEAGIPGFRIIFQSRDLFETPESVIVVRE